MAKLKYYEISILKNEFVSIAHEMDTVLHKASRSSQLNVGKDFSSGLTLGDGGEFIIEEGDPSHLGALSLVPSSIFQFTGRENIHPGDCYLTNSPLFGGTHHADFTLAVPIFCDSQLRFWAINRAHQSDVGAPLPTTYSATAGDIFQEGMHLPVMSIQSDYRDRKDLIRMIILKNRLPERWYGDYLAQIGALRIAEKRLITLCDKHGVKKISAFIDDWLDRCEKRMIEEIRRLPKATVEAELKHDPIWDVASVGVEIKARVRIDPEDAFITVDFTDNLTENLPFGFNVSEATLRAAAYWGVFTNLGYVPHNAGSYRRIRIEMNDGVVVGRPSPTSSTAVATTNIVGRAFSAVSLAFTGLGRPHGTAEGANGMLANWAVISGSDHRKKEDIYAAQIFIGAGGGFGLNSFDGWLTFGTPDSGGAMRFDSIESIEKNYPIFIKKVAIRKDSMGPGEWNGAPGLEVVFGPMDGELTLGYYGDCRENPPKGVFGGGPGAKAEIFKLDQHGQRRDLPLITDSEILRKGELVVSLTPGGGGYGSPLERDPEKVLKGVHDGWLSNNRAREIYGVVLEKKADRYVLNKAETDNLRTRIGS